jgi:hypothetical protein
MVHIYQVRYHYNNCYETDGDMPFINHFKMYVLTVQTHVCFTFRPTRNATQINAYWCSDQRVLQVSRIELEPNNARRYGL